MESCQRTKSKFEGGYILVVTSSWMSKCERDTSVFQHYLLHWSTLWSECPHGHETPVCSSTIYSMVWVSTWSWDTSVFQHYLLYGLSVHMVMRHQCVPALSTLWYECPHVHETPVCSNTIYSMVWVFTCSWDTSVFQHYLLYGLSVHMFMRHQCVPTLSTLWSECSHVYETPVCSNTFYSMVWVFTCSWDTSVFQHYLLYLYGVIECAVQSVGAMPSIFVCSAVLGMLWTLSAGSCYAVAGERGSVSSSQKFRYWMLMLLRACTKFDLSFEISFRTWASMRVLHLHYIYATCVYVLTSITIIRINYRCGRVQDVLGLT